MSLARRSLPWLLPHLLIGGFTLWTWALVRAGLSPLVAFGVTSTTYFPTLLLLERWLPHRPDWNQCDGQMANDIGHTLVGTVLGARIGHMLNDLAFGALAVWLASKAGGALWPTSLPWLAQLALVFVVADLGRYAQHRLHHAVPWLWRFHALHHDVQRLSAFKNSRSHPVERVLQAVFMFGPLLMLGAPEDVVFWFMASNSFLGMLDHSNVDARLGVLELVVNGPMNHRIHHSLDAREGNSNFGSALVLWDQVFGTWLNPLRRAEVHRLGIHEREPTRFWAQLASPFLSARPAHHAAGDGAIARANAESQRVARARTSRRGVSAGPPSEVSSRRV